MHKWKFIFILSIIRASTEFILYLGAVLISVEEKCAGEALSLSLTRDRCSCFEIGVAREGQLDLAYVQRCFVCT
jgi:hypothetical protein